MDLSISTIVGLLILASTPTIALLVFSSVFARRAHFWHAWCVVFGISLLLLSQIVRSAIIVMTAYDGTELPHLYYRPLVFTYMTSGRVGLLLVIIFGVITITLIKRQKHEKLQ